MSRFISELFVRTLVNLDAKTFDRLMLEVHLRRFRKELLNA